VTAITALSEMSHIGLDTLLDHLAGKAKLIVEFQGARLNGHRPRMLTRSFPIRNEPERHATAGQAQRQNKASRSGTDDQDAGFVHLFA